MRKNDVGVLSLFPHEILVGNRTASKAVFILEAVPIDRPFAKWRGHIWTAVASDDNPSSWREDQRARHRFAHRPTADGVPSEPDSSRLAHDAQSGVDVPLRYTLPPQSKASMIMLAQPYS